MAERDPHIYKVVVNHEEQYSIWLDDEKVPTDWQETGIQGAIEVCTDYIRKVWTDMRPLSLRKRLGDD